MLQADPSEKSLISILRQRYDTCFKGHEISESKFKEYQKHDILSTCMDEFGDCYTHQHDYIRRRSSDGRNVSILVADKDDKNCGVDHPHPDLPHLMGLYVRESHRSMGLASDMIGECLSEMDSDRCVVDCESDLKPFYEQLDCQVVFLDEFKSLD